MIRESLTENPEYFVSEKNCFGKSGYLLGVHCTIMGMGKTAGWTTQISMGSAVQTEAVETLELRSNESMAEEPAVHLPPSVQVGNLYADQLVRLPNVILLIEGDAVADLGWSGYPLPVRRLSLVDNVASLCAKTGAAAQILFDPSISPRSPHSRREHSVEVRVTASGVHPAFALAELIGRHTANRPLVVVSNDPGLRDERNHRAKPIDPGDLLDLFL